MRINSRTVLFTWLTWNVEIQRPSALMPTSCGWFSSNGTLLVFFHCFNCICMFFSVDSHLSFRGPSLCMLPCWIYAPHVWPPWWLMRDFIHVFLRNGFISVFSCCTLHCHVFESYYTWGQNYYRFYHGIVMHKIISLWRVLMACCVLPQKIAANQFHLKI